MEYDELTNEEQIVLAIFKKLIKNGGIIRSFRIMTNIIGGEGVFCIYKKNGKWISFIYERGIKSNYCEFNDLFSLCMNTLETIDENYLKEFTLLVDESLNNQRNNKTR